MAENSIVYNATTKEISIDNVGVVNTVEATNVEIDSDIDSELADAIAKIEELESEIATYKAKIEEFESQIVKLKVNNGLKKLRASIKTIDPEISSTFVIKLTIDELTALNDSLVRVSTKFKVKVDK